jgi:hypothetical protein
LRANVASRAIKEERAAMEEMETKKIQEVRPSPTEHSFFTASTQHVSH